jgi:hypothetical protein
VEFGYVGIIEFVLRNHGIFTSDLESAASQASARGDTEVVKALINLEPHINYSAALRAAAEHDQRDVVIVLLQWEGDDVARKHWRRLQLPYDVAKTKEVRELLIHHNLKDALKHMVEKRHIEEARKLLETTRQTPLDAKAKAEILEIATDYGNTNMVRLLREFDYRSQYAYICAISRKDLCLAELLNGDPNEMVDGRRPLHAAVWASFVEGIKYLLDNGADKTLLDGCHQSALGVASYKKDELAIRALKGLCHQYPIRRRTRYATKGLKQTRYVTKGRMQPKIES